MSGIWLLLSLLASAFAAVCAAADGALLALDADEDALTEPMQALRDRRERTHRALAFARIIGHLGAGTALATALVLGSLDGGAAFAVGLVIGVAIVLLSESVARDVGTLLGARAAAGLLPLILVVERVLSPVVVMGSWIERTLDALLPVPTPDEEDREASAEQFRQVVAAEAEVSHQDEALLHGVFSLGATEVHEVMVPRVDIVGIEQTAPWSEVVDRVRSSEHARLPMYDETIDDIIGILYAKDLLPAIVEDEPPENGWTALVRPVVIIPRTKTIDAQLRDFQQSRTHIAIVVDEFGGTAGLVTIEDILEEIVGEIRDEYDVEEAPVEQRDGVRYWVSGRVTLDELSEALGHDFHREGVTTVGGLVYELLGRVPHAGESFTLDGFRVVIERVRRRRVDRVFFERSVLAEERAE